MSFAQDIEHWFGTEWGGSMVLPDGWFGRPYDNQHMLTSVTENGGEVTLVLDDNLRLHFTGLKTVRAKRRELIFGPFKHLRFEWTPYGGGRLTTKDFLSGEVKIVSLGT